MDTKLQKLNRKSMVFTVEDETGDKPIVRAELTDDRARDDQKFAEALICVWAVNHFQVNEYQRLIAQLEDLAYDMRKNGFAWFDENWCFELSELKSPGAL